MANATAMTIEAFAKVNFTLEVFGKRVDGYHALRSTVVPVSLSDALELTQAVGISSDSGYADDLCVKAAKVLLGEIREGAQSGSWRGEIPSGVRIHVEKRIPAGGGLGGGSADAAAVLWALNAMWGLGYAPERLAVVGAAVGSDVPALVLSRAHGPILMAGRGEIVSPLLDDEPSFAAAHGMHLVLVNPGVFSSTAEVYRECSPRLSDAPSILYNIRNALAAGNVAGAAAALMNDLEEPAMRLHPEIAEAKRELLAAGAAGALMSGSGSTVFGLVPNEAQGREIAALLEAKGLKAWSVHTVCPVV